MAGNISEPFVKRPVMTTVVMIAISFFGILSYLKMPVSDLPDIEYPTIQVTTSYPGASPDTIADSVTSVLERQFATIDNVRTISSASSNGNSMIVLQFGLDKPLDVAAQDTQTAINQAMVLLPKNLPNNPVYKKVNPAATPIVVYSLSSTTDSRQRIYDYAFSLFSNRLSMIEGVSQITLFGSPFAVRVQLDPDKLSAKGISFEQVREVIVKGNPDLPTGTLYGPDVEFNLNADGQIYTAEGYNELIVRNDDNSMVRVKDLGKAINSLQNDKTTQWYYNEEITAPSVLLLALKQPGVNTIRVIDQIKELMPKLMKDLPASMELVTIFDQSAWIFMSVNDVEFTLLIAFMLVILVTILYFGKIKDAMIPVCALPITILGTFIVMYILGFSIDILSLLSITLAIGFLIDDAIVVLENIVRHIEMGEDRMTASLNGSKQVAFTVVSTSLSLIAVFIPLLFMTGMIGRIFREFAATIIIAVAISSFIALSLTPLLCSRFVTLHNKGNPNWLERFSERLNNVMQGTYKRGLIVVMRHKFVTTVCGFLGVALTIGLFIYIPKDFLPPDDLGFIQGYTILADDASVYECERIQSQIAEICRANPASDAVITVAAKPYDNQGLFWVKLKDLDKRDPMPEVIAQLYQDLSAVVGARIFMKPFPLINLDIGTSSVSGSYQYILESMNQHELYDNAIKFVSRLKDIPGISHVNADMHLNYPQVDMTINRDKASSYKVTANGIETALMLAYGGTKISQINSTVNNYEVIMETQPEYYRDPSVLKKLYVINEDAELVPLTQVVDWKDNLSPVTIMHTNTAPSVTIAFDIEGVPLGAALESIEALAADMLPQTVAGHVFGSAQAFKAVFADLIYLCIIAIFIIYVILGVLYEDFMHPLTVMSALPPAALSGLLTLLIFQETLSLYAFVGLIMLVGIVLKNGIIMIDFAIEMMHDHPEMSAEQAIFDSAITRFRPIIMTTFSTLMGAVPIAIGVGGLTAQSRRPVGLVIVGGLIFSQILTLFLTPVVFTVLEKIKKFLTFSKQESH